MSDGAIQRRHRAHAAPHADRARWTANEYTITFDSAGGTTVNDITLPYGSAVTAPAAPTKPGYTFAGWDPAVPTTMPLDGANLTAEWTANEYTITYALGGGSGSVPTDSTNYHIGDTVTVEFTPLPARTGYTFVGWSDGATTYTSGGTESFTMGSSNVTLTAEWTAINYTVTYALGGGSGSVPTDSTNYHIGDTVTVEFTPLPTRTGYTFVGWSDGATTYTSGGTESFTMGSSNVTLTAQWTANEYTITFDSAGGTTVNDITLPYGSAVTAPAAPTKPGYTFAGWDPAVPTTMPLDGANLTAQWTADSHTVAYALGGGTGTLPTQAPVPTSGTFTIASGSGLTRSATALWAGTMAPTPTRQASPTPWAPATSP